MHYWQCRPTNPLLKACVINAGPATDASVVVEHVLVARLLRANTHATTSRVVNVVVMMVVVPTEIILQPPRRKREKVVVPVTSKHRNMCTSASMPRWLASSQLPMGGRAEGAAADFVKLRSVGTRYVTLQEGYERTKTPQQWGYLLD